MIIKNFDSQYYICIKTDVLRYAISEVFSQITSDQLFSSHVTYKSLDPNPKYKVGQWYLITFFSKKMISTQNWYKTYNQELQVIIKILKSWCYYFYSCKYKVFVLIYRNNFYWFIDRKSLSSYQVW